MSQILLLTKNTLNEQTFETNLRQLGHEVFTSTVLIDSCLFGTTMRELTKIFQHVVLSETIANDEIRKLARKMKGYSLSVLRKSDEQLEEAQMTEWRELGITDWIESQPELEVLREKLSCKRVMVEQKVVLLPQSSERRALTSLTLSSGELKLFQLLYEQKQTVSREELCLRMWNREKCNSSMSQLSVMVKNLKIKLTGQHIEGPIIETCWGQGYKLHESVYDQIYVNTEESQIM